MDLRTLSGVAELVANPWAMCRSVIAEFVSLTLLLILGFGSGLSIVEPYFNPDFFQKSIGGGLSIIGPIQMSFYVSGAHLNPAITIPMTCVGRTRPIKAILYIIAQIAAAMVSAAFLVFIIPDLNLKDFVIQPVVVMTTCQIFAVEFVVNFVLMMAGCTLADERVLPTRGTEAIIMGLVVVSCHLFAIKFTGCGLNPARVLGPAILTNHWDNVWVYCLGEISGGIAAAFCYFFVFSERPQTAQTVRTTRLRSLTNPKIEPGDTFYRPYRQQRRVS